MAVIVVIALAVCKLERSCPLRMHFLDHNLCLMEVWLLLYMKTFEKKGGERAEKRNDLNVNVDVYN